jgi:hypothetical protein
MSEDLRKLYRDLIEPELNDIHQWLDVTERSETCGNTADMSLLAAQYEILHLVEMDRRVTILEARWLNDQ